MGRVLRLYVPIHKILEQPWRYFTSLKLCNCYQIPPPSLRVPSTPNKKKKPTTIDLVIYKHSTHTKLHHFVRSRSAWKLSNPWGDKRKSWTHLPFSVHLLIIRNKKIKP